ncbi:MAG: hypothetical protein AAB152_12245 [Candidatus Coatesbacteria bacterium]
MVFQTFLSYNAFDSLKYLDLSGIYAQYSSLIDLTLYFIIFLGLSKFVFDKRFPGRGGKAITIGVGAVLAVSLAVAEGRLGFNLQSFSPIAGLIVILAVGFVLYALWRGMGTPVWISILISLVVMYFGVGSVTPAFLVWVGAHIPLLYVAVVLAIVVLVIAGLFSLMDHIEGSKLSHYLDPAPGWERDPRAKQDVLREEESMLALEQRVGGEVAHGLKESYLQLARHGAKPVLAERIQSAVIDAQDKEHLLMQKLDYLDTVNKKLKAFDLGLFHNLTREYTRLTAAQQPKMRKFIERERSRFFEEADIEDLASKAKAALAEYQATLQRAADELHKNNAPKATEWLKRAVDLEEVVNRMLRKLQGREHQLRKLIKA